jgi:hypothetical protein
MPVLSKAGANLPHTARAAALALNFGVGHRGVPGLQAAAPGVCALRSACRTPAVGRRQIAGSATHCIFSLPSGRACFPGRRWLRLSAFGTMSASYDGERENPHCRVPMVW